MGYEVVWSPAALEDIESLADYIARGNRITILAILHGKRLPDLLKDRIESS